MTNETTLPAANSAYLGTQPVGKLLLKFSVPCVLSMLVSALYNIVDQIFIGQGVGYLGNAATNVVYPFTVVALALALLIGDGSAALFSLSQGQGETEATHRSVGSCMLLAGVAAIVFTAAGFIWIDPILRLFGVTPACYTYAVEYMRVILLGLPAYMLTSALNGIIRADGAPRYAMVATVIGALINLVLDPVAIFVLHTGVTGAAVATIIGQTATGVLSLLYFRKGKTRTFRLQKSSFAFSGKICQKIGQLGISSFIIQVAIVVVIGVANNLIVHHGPTSVYGADIPLSAVGIVMKVFAIVIAFAVGIAVGGQPIAGYNYGAKNYARVFETYKYILLANVGVGVVATLLFELFPQGIVRLFGNENALYNEYAVLCFRIYLAGILLCCIQKATCIFFQSIGKPAQSTLLSLARDVVFFVPGLLLLAPRFGVTGMLWAAPITDCLALLLTTCMVWAEYRNIRRETSESQPLPNLLNPEYL